MKYYENIDYWVRKVEFPNMASPSVVVPNDDGTFTIYINTLFSEERQEKALKHELEHLEKEHFYRDDCEIGDLEAAANGEASTPPQAPMPKIEVPLALPKTKVIPIYHGLNAILYDAIASGAFQKSIEEAHARGIKLYGIDDTA